MQCKFVSTAAHITVCEQMCVKQLRGLNFMIASCINNIKHFIVQLMHKL